ncbi:quinone oxidoreductase family protein [Rhodoblastus sp.]|uniref:quinone oxidoreductase family protein n=1 Tax=Rhodoblastus sp. TaxID=1962975 RepID=UPI003F9EA742
MLKAIRVHETGGPEVLRYEGLGDLPPPGPGEVQIRQHAVGVNYLDVYFRTGAYPAPSLPFIPGNEGAGEVVAVGEGVTRLKRGDRVAYAGSLGAYASARNIEAKFVVTLPDKVSSETAAAMMLKGLTAEYLLFRSYQVQPGDIVLVHAAAGGVGLILCQWAKNLGATVIATVGSEDKAKMAREAGARHTILYRSEDWVARVREITGGKLCNVVYDGVGKATFPGSLDCLRPLGSFISFGSASGPIEAFNIGLLAQKGSLYVQRPSLFTYIADEARLREMAARLMAAVGSGQVKIAIHARYKLEEAAQAHRQLESRQTTGATVLVP